MQPLNWDKAIMSFFFATHVQYVWWSRSLWDQADEQALGHLSDPEDKQQIEHNEVSFFFAVSDGLKEG